MTQCELILNHLKSGKPLSALPALRLFGCWRLAARIAELRNDGYVIVTRMVTTKSHKRIAVYSLA